MSVSKLKASSRHPVLSVIASASHAVGTVTAGAVVDMGRFFTAMLVLSVGAFGSNATATVKWQQSQKEDFSNPKDIDGRSAVDLAAATPTQLNLSAGELDLNNGYRYARPVVTIGTAAVHLGGVVIGVDARDLPATPLTGTIVD